MFALASNSVRLVLFLRGVTSFAFVVMSSSVMLLLLAVIFSTTLRSVAVAAVRQETELESSCWKTVLAWPCNPPTSVKV